MTVVGLPVQARHRARVAGRAALVAFAAAILTGAFLVFLVQPLAAKLLLPRFGGSPAVWTTSLLFFQAALLVGYGWAHLTTTRLGRRWQPLTQSTLLIAAVLLLPIGLPEWATPPAEADPALWLLLVLAAAVGLPYLAVTTASPVLQRWFSWTDHPLGSDPYFLYAAGNVGSLAALLAYPLLVEPNLEVDEQASLWSAGYMLFMALSAVAIVLVVRHARPSVSMAVPENTADVAGAWMASAPPLRIRRRLAWVAFAFVPSSLMIGATTYVTSDLAALPLLWILPLSLYLLTFILAFSPRNPLTPARLSLLLPVAVVVLAAAMLRVIEVSMAAVIALNLAVFFVAALLAHGRLADDRPDSSRLTEFYFLLAVGGVLGGVFNALVAPAIFDSVLEYPLAIVLALLLRPGRADADQRAERRARRLDLIFPVTVLLGTLVSLVILSRSFAASADALAAWLALIGVGLLFTLRRPIRFALSIGVILMLPLVVGGGTLVADRSFYGVNRVIDEGEVRLLVHGTTNHGGQSLDPSRAMDPLTYYHRTGPFGRALDGFREHHPGPLRIAVIGLGAGGIAAHGKAGDEITFFEIDPVVIRIARDPALFTFLSGTKADVRVVLGDGRLTLAEEPDEAYDVLILDAFSGDAPPPHLLTLEALALYQDKVTPDGLLLFNASNRYVDVASVLEAGLMKSGLKGFTPRDPHPETPPLPEKQPSVWLAASPDPATIAALRARVGGEPFRTDSPVRPWTDGFSDLVSVIRW